MLPKRFTGAPARCVLLSIAVWSTTAPASANDMFWSNTRGDGSGTFSSALNWVTAVPGGSDVAHFGMTVGGQFQATYTVAFTADATNQKLIVEDDVVTFDLNGHVYRTTISGNQIGTTAAASLILTDGTWEDTTAGFLGIGSVGGASGSLIVSTGGQYTGKRIDVGSFGPGVLTVQNAGSVQSTFIPIGSSASGVVNVTGANSTIVTAALNVGALAPGKLNIAAGGRFQNSGPCFVGDGLDVTGEVNVDGANSLWTNTGQVDLGRKGHATLAVTAGGHADLGNTFIGAVDPAGVGTGSVTINGANSQLTTVNLHIGQLGAGELHLASGAFAKNTGTELDIGVEGEGEVEILSGGRLEAVESILGSLTAAGTAAVSGADRAGSTREGSKSANSRQAH